MTKQQADECSKLVSKDIVDVLTALHMAGKIGDFDCELNAIKVAGKTMPGAHLLVRYYNPRNQDPVLVVDRIFTAKNIGTNVLDYVDYYDFLIEIERVIKKLFTTFPVTFN